MKIVSLDFNTVNYIGGIASFNRNLNLIFDNNIRYISLYKNKVNPSLLDNEKNIGIRKNFLTKMMNYFSNYKISSFLIAREVNKDEVCILNSPSFIRSEIKCKSLILVQHQDLDIMFTNRSNFGGSREFLSHVMSKIDKFVVLTESDRNSAINKYGFKPKQVITIPHALRIDIIEKKVRPSKNIAMLTRLDNKQKRVDLVINAMKKLPDWNLNIYGDGPDKKYLNSLINKNKLNNVFLHGRVSDIRSVLDENAIHVMSSDFEGFGLSNIEAAARGLPLIIRDTYCAANELIDGNGFLLKKNWDDEEFISAVLNIYSNYDIYSDNSINMARKFSFLNVKSKWINLIKEL
ncbi:glycosyltransferase [Vibrio cholerae]|nr:glycosyltransferase [Vibrio cholerae]ELO1827249.1 glycosyltransferase [Vibrio cholerae]